MVAISSSWNFKRKFIKNIHQKINFQLMTSWHYLKLHLLIISSLMIKPYLICSKHLLKEKQRMLHYSSLRISYGVGVDWVREIRNCGSAFRHKLSAESTSSSLVNWLSFTTQSAHLFMRVNKSYPFLNKSSFLYQTRKQTNIIT